MAKSTDLKTWLLRSRPPRAQITKALLLGSLGALANVGLLIGAIGLLVESSRRPGLAAVAVALILIEIFAFLRSPLRFIERTSSHRLGFSAVRQWRQWLLRTVGLWNFSQWRLYASGDLLQRALDDTDELQGLWLRGVLPFVQAVVVLVTTDVLLIVLPEKSGWGLALPSYIALQVVTVLLLTQELRPHRVLDETRRTAKAHLQTVITDFSRVGPELALLHRSDLYEKRLEVASALLRQSEQQLESRSYRLKFAVIISTLCGVLLLVPDFHSSPLYIALVAMIGVSAGDCYAQVAGAVESSVAVLAGASRLDALEHTTATGSSPWPMSFDLAARDIELREHQTLVLKAASFNVNAGERVCISAPSGSGKSTLLRVLAGLDEAFAGEVEVGGTPMRLINENVLRQHLAYVPSTPGLVRGYCRDVLTLGRSTTVDYVTLLNKLGLDVGPDTYLENLSGGETVRIALVRALLTSPDIVLLDEPTAALGAHETALVLQLLEETTATVVIASHDPAVVQWCGRVIHIDGHQLVEN